MDHVKRSLKMTQINQVMIENESYKNECIRLRDNLEKAMRQIQKQT